MKRILIVLPILLVFALSLVGHVQAKPRSIVRPASLNCSAGCWSELSWPGTVKGAQSYITVSNPNMTGSNSWQRYIYLTEGAFGVVALGMEKNAGCGTGLYFFSDVVDSGNNYIHPDVGSSCTLISNSGDIGANATFEESAFTSGGGGIFTEFVGSSSGAHVNWYHHNNSPNVYQTYGDILLHEQLDATITGHAVWGSVWSFNQWADGTNWYYVGHPSFGQCGTAAGCPSKSDTAPQMYWQYYPGDPGTQGGSLYSCDYDSGLGCTLGS